MILKATSRIGYPWKNNRGIQYDIASLNPAGEIVHETNEWHWKLLTADITEPQTPFSSFPGIFREFVVAQGAGVVLIIDGIEKLCPCGSITRFRGDADTTCFLMNGPVQALNLIAREGFGGYLFKVFDAASGESIIDFYPCIVVAIKGNATLCTPHGMLNKINLQLLDAVQFDSRFLLQVGTIAVFSVSPATTESRGDDLMKLAEGNQKIPETESMELNRNLARYGSYLED